MLSLTRRVSLYAGPSAGLQHSQTSIFPIQWVSIQSHTTPSTIGTDTLFLSRGRISEEFLRGFGLAPWADFPIRVFGFRVGPLVLDMQEVRGSSPLSPNLKSIIRKRLRHLHPVAFRASCPVTILSGHCHGFPCNSLEPSPRIRLTNAQRSIFDHRSGPLAALCGPSRMCQSANVPCRVIRRKTRRSFATTPEKVAPAGRQLNSRTTFDNNLSMRNP